MALEVAHGGAATPASDVWAGARAAHGEAAVVVAWGGSSRTNAPVLTASPGFMSDTGSSASTDMPEVRE